MLYVVSYFDLLTSQYQREVDTVYKVFEKEMVCEVMVTLINRVFNDPTSGVGHDCYSIIILLLYYFITLLLYTLLYYSITTVWLYI